jgi:hypothetical protein
MSDSKNTEVVVKEFYGDPCLSDGVGNSPKNSERRPQGEVQIFEADEQGNKKLVHKSNLVLYLGREMLAQRLVNVENPLATPTKDEYVAWFGIGEGGVRPADPLDPVPPIITDEGLASPVMITDSTAAGYGDWHVVGEPTPSGGTYPKDGYYKKRFDGSVPGGNPSFEADALNDDKYLVIKIQTTIGVNDANGEQLSEAGLFSAESVAPAYSGQFSIFARVTFPSLIKTSQRRLIFVWYLYL